MNKKKKVSETQEAIEYLISQGHADAFDPMAVTRFAQEALRRQDTTKDDAAQAAIFLTALMEGAFHGDNMTSQIREILDIRKPIEKRWFPMMAQPGTPAWEIMVAVGYKEISAVEGRRRFNEQVCAASDRQIERWFKECLPWVMARHKSRARHEK